MLYIFRVDTGNMLQMDMNLALATVSELKGAIEKSCKIPVDKQVLLASGGEVLDLQTRVCSYSAGTDTNPIFLFSKCSLNNRSISPQHDVYDTGMTEQVEQSLDLPPTISTVVRRAALAQSLCELGKEVARDCEKVILDQHLQQQGWSAAIANLEDMADFFRERSSIFQKDFQVHLDARESNLNTLKNFSNELHTLARIPILPPLLSNAISLSGLDLDTKMTTMTLLEWISAKDNQSSLQTVAEQCTAFLQQTDSSVLENLVRNVDVALDIASKSDMKEIRGLTERLCGLEQLMVRARRLVQEQSELAQGFQQNQNRASNLGDASILPDLCASHKKQLLVMNENQTKLKDIRRRCLKAKEELSENLLHRMRWVAYAQNEMQTVGSNMMIYQESLKRGRKQLMIIRQVQRAPEMYCLAVAEVVRRRKFSSAFLKWANDLSNRLLATYNEESERRREFKVQFGGHFLEALFQGLDDEPSSYATQAPEPFDVYIPDISEQDMEMLRQTLPDLALNVSWTELSNVAQMFLSKTIDQEDLKSDLPLEARIVATVSQIGLSNKMDDALLRPDDSSNRKFESEYVTDEFEKVPQCRLAEKSDSIDSKGTTDFLRQNLCQTSQLVLSLASSFKKDLNDLRNKSIADKDSVFELVAHIQSHIVQLTEGYVAELLAVQSRLELSEANANGRITELETLLDVKDASLKEQVEANRIFRQDTEIHVESLNISHEKDVATLKETFRIKENEFLAEKESLRSDVQELNSELDKAKNTLKEEEMRKAEEISRISADWVTKLGQLKDDYEERIETLRELANAETKRLEDQLTDIKQKLVQTELTAEIELENRVKELEVEHAKACQELEVRLTSQRDQDVAEIQKKHQVAIEELKERLGNEHQAELQEVSHRLMNEYKTELGGLRSRFRLMSITSMEKSPSDSSLEKIERGDMIELVNHEAIVGQVREDAEVAQEKAVAEAVSAEQQRSKVRLEEAMLAAKARMEEEKQVWLEEAVTRAMADRERQLEEELGLAKARLEEDRQVMLTEAVNLACAEKDRQIEAMVERHKVLSTECQRHRDTIRRLTDNDHLRTGAGTVDPLVERVSNLEKEKAELVQETKLLRQLAKDSRISDRRKRGDSECSVLRTSTSSDTDVRVVEGKVDDMSQSVAVLTMESSYRDAGTSPEFARARNRMSRSMRDTTGMLCLNSCNVDDPVLVAWSIEYSNYVIFQDSSTLYFLHPDCLDTLALRPSSDGSPRRLYAVAQVVRKEFCNAKKSDNRYKVATGTRFYRVVVKPLTRDGAVLHLPPLPSAADDTDSLS